MHPLPLWSTNTLECDDCTHLLTPQTALHVPIMTAALSKHYKLCKLYILLHTTRAPPIVRTLELLIVISLWHAVLLLRPYFMRLLLLLVCVHFPASLRKFPPVVVPLGIFRNSYWRCLNGYEFCSTFDFTLFVFLDRFEVFRIKLFLS